MRSLVLPVLAFTLAAELSAACTERLAPSAVRALPKEELLRARDVTWADDQKLLIGASRGIWSYTIAGGAVAQLVPPSEINEVQRLDSDGVTVVAANMEFTDIAADARTGNVRERRQRMAMVITDLTVRGTRLAVLGVPRRVPGVEFGTVWLGSIGAPWDSFTGLRPTPPERTELVRRTFPPYGGAITQQKDGTIAVVTPYEPGVHRYAPDGSALPVLAGELRDLVVERFADLTGKYAKDVEGRYVEILNRQSTIDDLVDTSGGLAIVVRRASAGTVGWELWFPDAKTTKRRIRLELDRKQIAGPHLRCDGRGSRIACIFGKQTAPLQPEDPTLVLFDLDHVKRSACK